MDNFRRNDPKHDDQDGDGEGEQRPGNEKAQEYTKELLAEKLKLSSLNLPHCQKILDDEIERSRFMTRAPRDNKYADLYHDKLVKVDVKVLIPIKEYPKFNFVGKLLGPKGNTMKKLKDETMCKISVFGKGSMRDKVKEEELRNSLDPKYAHLQEELHVGVSALAPPAEAYARIAFALAEIRKYMVPDSDDPIRQGQMHEMYANQPPPVPPQYRQLPPPPPPASRGHGGGGRGRMGPGQRPPPAAKANVLSILDRARAAMEESYGFNDSYDAPAAPARHQEDYDSYYDEQAPAERDYYNSAPAGDNNAYYGGGGGNEFVPSFKSRPMGVGAGPGPRRDGRPFGRPAPYNRPK